MTVLEQHGLLLNNSSRVVSLAGMPRPILPLSQSSQPPSVTPRGAAPKSGLELAARLRQKRSGAFVTAVGKLDVGSHQVDPASLAALLEAIASEFPDLTLTQRPLGIVAPCRLGHPYEVHICDLSGSIVEHYESYRHMPAPFEKARTLALHPSYSFIEVYHDTLRAVAPDGRVSVLEDNL